MGSSFREDWSVSRRLAPAFAKACANMSVSAVVEGFEVEDGDVLMAYSNGETIGEAALSPQTSDLSPLFYLTISGDAQRPIWFAIERGGEIVAATDEVMTFKKNAVIGSPDEPTAINFVQVEYENGKWYTLSGVQLPNKPTQKGIYIFNGKKVVVK